MGSLPRRGAEASLIAGAVIDLAAFNAQLLAREHMVRTNPGSLRAARIARTGGERQSAAVAAPALARQVHGITSERWGPAIVSVEI
jgi:hypothetical protein